MIRSLVDTYRHEGYLPDCRMSFCKGYTQGGSNSDVLIVDAYLKGIPGIDWDTAYQAIVNDAENEPADFTVEGRGNLTQWKDLGYIPTHDPASPTPGNAALYTRSISRTVEYAYNDFCISVMANKTGKQDDYEKYTGRAKNWKNMFNSDQNSTVQGHDTGFTGFLQPKYENGTWAEQDPAFCSPISNPDSCFFGMANYETYEGSVWMYTLCVPNLPFT
jgi:putative alpha-1,2-mannosidase